MGFKMRGNPFKQTESKEDRYARLIKEHNMTKDEGGRWRDAKGRDINEIVQKYPANPDGTSKQRRNKLDVDGNLIEKNKNKTAQ
tara:strand:+ start:168 stop:419 length:252 start_codon:yes stop_codon:yes gene_type:complete